MPVRGRMTLGLDEYLETLVRAEKNVDEVVSELVEEAGPYAVGLMSHYLYASSENWTGATAKTLFSSDVQKDGNFIFVEIGADTQKDPAGWYKEFGRPNQAAEPFLRPTLVQYRRKELKRMMEKIIQKYGLPT